MPRTVSLIILLVLGQRSLAEEAFQALDVAYGPHPRHVLDFYQAKSDHPAPAVFYIHGGGWQTGDKKINPAAYLAKGISVISINYRYLSHAVQDNVKPPIKAPLQDAARALQFVRSQADEWNLDKTRIAATGFSAGGFTALWLAFHDDMADPQSKDPVARESTRVFCAAVQAAQVSLDPKELRAWMPNYNSGSKAFGVRDFQTMTDVRGRLLPWIKEYSPIEHVSQDDPPIALFYPGEVPVVGSSPKDPIHSGVLGVKLAERLKAANVDVVLVHPGQPHPVYKNFVDYLIERLTE